MQSSSVIWRYNATVWSRINVLSFMCKRKQNNFLEKRNTQLRSENSWVREWDLRSTQVRISHFWVPWTGINETWRVPDGMTESFIVWVNVCTSSGSILPHHRSEIRVVESAMGIRLKILDRHKRSRQHRLLAGKNILLTISYIFLDQSSPKPSWNRPKLRRLRPIRAWEVDECSLGTGYGHEKSTIRGRIPRGGGLSN